MTALELITKERDKARRAAVIHKERGHKREEANARARAAAYDHARYIVQSERVGR